MLAVRETVIYPGALLPITVGRPTSLALVQSLGENRTLAVISQRDPRVEEPGPSDLYEVGTVCVMHKAIKVPKDNLLLFCEGIARVRAKEFTATDPFLKARVERLAELEPEMTPEIEALRQNVVSLFQQIVNASANLSDELATNAASTPGTGAAGRFRGRQSAGPGPRRAAAAARNTGWRRASARGATGTSPANWNWSSCAGGSNRRCRGSSRRASASSISASS